MPASLISTNLADARAAAAAARKRAEEAQMAARQAEEEASAADAALVEAGGHGSAPSELAIRCVVLRTAADEAKRFVDIAVAEAKSLEILADVVAERVALEAELGGGAKQ
jgi:hypothetical protein